MDILFFVKFGLIVCLVVATAWHDQVVRLAASLRLKGKVSYLFAIVWLGIAALFWSLFWKTAEFWQLLALLTEIAGATFLAKEVSFAQQLEEFNRLARQEHLITQIKLPLNNDSDAEQYIKKVYAITEDTSPDEVTEEIVRKKADKTLLRETLKYQIQVETAYKRHKQQLAEIPAYKFRKRLLRIGLLLIIAGLTGHGLDALTLKEQPPKSAPGQAFFQAGKPIQFDPGKAAVRNELEKTDLTSDICSAKRELTAAHSTVAIAVGRHDQTPLSQSARSMFSTNAGLAQQRAEAVARILEQANECGPAIPTVIALSRSPRNVGDAIKQQPLLAQDREVAIYGMKSTGN
jgi:hypothetical protein